MIEPGTHVRVKIIGTRTEVGEMWAIGSIKEDYLGYETSTIDLLDIRLLASQLPPRLIHDYYDLTKFFTLRLHRLSTDLHQPLDLHRHRLRNLPKLYGVIIG